MNLNWNWSSTQIFVIHKDELTTQIHTPIRRHIESDTTITIAMSAEAANGYRNSIKRRTRSEIVLICSWNIEVRTACCIKNIYKDQRIHIRFPCESKRNKVQRFFSLSSFEIFFSVKLRKVTKELKIK